MRAGETKDAARCCGCTATITHSNARTGSPEEFLERVRGHRYRSEKLHDFRRIRFRKTLVCRPDF